MTTVILLLLQNNGCHLGNAANTGNNS